MDLDVIQMVYDGRGYFEWTEIVSEYNGYKLYPNVMRDAMKFDDLPAMTWNREPIARDSRIFDGVRLPATAHELQQIADMFGAMLMTPKIISLIWLQAGLKFDAIVNLQGKIVANCNIHDVHQAIESALAAIGGDNGTKLVDCVGKYWCLVDQLARKGRVQGDWAACNYGWFSRDASGPGVISGTRCWQRPGFAHNKQHMDPSQTIRFMYCQALLVHPNKTEEMVDLRDIAQDPKLCPLLTHDSKPLTYLRQRGVFKSDLLPAYRTTILPGDRTTLDGVTK